MSENAEKLFVSGDEFNLDVSLDQNSNRFSLMLILQRKSLNPQTGTADDPLSKKKKKISASPVTD